MCFFSTNKDMHEDISFSVQFMLPVMYLTSGPVISDVQRNPHRASAAPANIDKRTHIYILYMHASRHTYANMNAFKTQLDVGA